MMHIADLYYTCQARASIFVWVAGPAAIVLESDAKSEGSSDIESGASFFVRNGKGTEIIGHWGVHVQIPLPGIWEVELVPTVPATAMSVGIAVEGEAYPFVIPGPGLNPSHFPAPNPTLLFPSGKATELWFDVPAVIRVVHIGAWLGRIDLGKDYGIVEMPGGTVVPLGLEMPSARAIVLSRGRDGRQGSRRLVEAGAACRESASSDHGMGRTAPVFT